MKLTYSNRHFSSSILEKLIEDRRTVHAKRISNNRNIVELVAGDIVMVRNIFQSNASKHKDAKLSYQDRGPFCIIKYTGREDYIVRKLYKPDSSKQKFMAIDRYPFLPSFKLLESVNSSDTIYLNQSYSAVINLQSKPLNMELYQKKV